MGWSLTLGSIGGIKVRIHLTFLAFLAWIGLSEWHQGGPAAAAQAVAYMLALFACVVAHEFGHITMAARFGGVTQDVVLLPIGGVARMTRIPEKPAQELLVALAGPAVNVVIFAVLLAAITPQTLLAQISGEAALPLLSELAIANLVLAIFNLLPAFPMDGGRALRALLALRLGRDRATTLAAKVGHVLAVGLGAYGLFGGQPMLVLVATFIYFGATSEARGTALHSLTSHLLARDAMLTRLAALGPEAQLSDAADLLIHAPQPDIPILDAMGKPVGLLTRDALARALHTQGPQTSVIDAMLPGLPTLPGTAPLDRALAHLESGAPAVAIIDHNGALTGLITHESLGHLLLLSRNPKGQTR